MIDKLSACRTGDSPTGIATQSTERQLIIYQNMDVEMDSVSSLSRPPSPTTSADTGDVLPRLGSFEWVLSGPLRRVANL
jgi:hypothetical protein